MTKVKHITQLGIPKFLVIAFANVTRMMCFISSQNGYQALYDPFLRDRLAGGDGRTTAPSLFNKTGS